MLAPKLNTVKLTKLYPMLYLITGSLTKSVNKYKWSKQSKIDSSLKYSIFLLSGSLKGLI
jgi:hypothetical protein